MESGTEDFAHTRAAGSRSRERDPAPASGDGDWVQSLARIAPVGIIRADAQGRFIYANARWCEMTGYPAETALGLGWDRVVHPEDVEKVRAAWRSMRERGIPFGLEFRQVRPNGREIWIFSQAVEVRDDQGRLTGYVATTLDITELRRTREELDRSRKELETEVLRQSAQWKQMAAIVAASTDAIISSDLEGNIASWNEAAERIFGYTAAEMIGRSTFAITPANRLKDAHAVKDRMRRGESINHFETVRVARSGELIEVAMSAFPLRDERGALSGTCAIVHDVREQKKAERRVRQLSERLLRVQDEERRRLARDLHDSTAQALTALSLNLACLSRPDADLPEAKRAKLLADSLALAEELGRELRTHAYLLHPPLLEECGLPAALRWLAEGFSARSGIATEVIVPLALPRFNDQLELIAFRVVQEALSNIHRHTRSPSAEIQMRQEAGAVILEIRDAGGAVAKTGGPCGVGIAGMRERLAQVGGSLRVTFHPAGTRVLARLPVA